MTLYVEALDALVTQLADATGINVSRDASVFPSLLVTTNESGLLEGAIFVGFPTHVKRTLGGANLEVPVSLVSPGPGDLQSTDWLLSHYDKFIEICGAKAVTIRPFPIGDAQYPAVTATVQLLVEGE